MLENGSAAAADSPLLIDTVSYRKLIATVLSTLQARFRTLLFGLLDRRGRLPASLSSVGWMCVILEGYGRNGHVQLNCVAALSRRSRTASYWHTRWKVNIYRNPRYRFLSRSERWPEASSVSLDDTRTRAVSDLCQDKVRPVDGQSREIAFLQELQDRHDGRSRVQDGVSRHARHWSRYGRIR